MPRLNTYWLSVSLAWMTVVGLTFWNLSTIEAVSLARDRSERLHNERLFQHQYTGQLESMQQTAESFTLAVDSPKLGFLAVQNQLESLGAIFGLEKFKIIRQSGAETQAQWPLAVSFEGPLTAGVQFLSALETYPYLPVAHSRLIIDPETQRTSVEIQLAFRFRLTNADDPPAGPLRTTRYPTLHKELPS